MNQRLVLLACLTMVAFAANSILNRLALVDAGTGPAAFAAVRLGAGAATLGAMVMLRQGSLSKLRGAMQWQNGLALVVYALGFSYAYVSLDAGLGALILFGGVQVTMFVGGLLGGEVIPPRRWLGAGLAFLGLVGLLWPVGASAPPFVGAVLMLVAAVGWGWYSLLGRKAKDPLAMTAGAFCLAMPVGAIFVLLFPDAITLRGAVLAVISGAVTSGLGYALWYHLLPQLTASLAAVAQLTVPVIAMVGGMIFLGEPLTLRFCLAAICVLGGVAVAVTAKAKAP